MKLMTGSLQDLVRDATAGILNCSYMNPTVKLSSSNVGLWSLCPDAFGSKIDTYMPEQAQCDDGYFGGEELDDDNSCDGTFISSNAGSPRISESINHILQEEKKECLRKIQH
jgi:hypothetical protein